MIKEYYWLAKPGIIYGNLITATAGFFLAAGRYGSYVTLFAMLLGLSLIIGAFCVFNNIVDQDIDLLMDRTKHRAIVAGRISKRNALIYGLALALIGSYVLFHWTNLLTLAIALSGGIIYLAIYTPMKRRSAHSTIFGSFSGAVPPVVGYVSVTNRLDSAASILFVILLFWQMPHFYSIAIFRLKDYTNAHMPIMPTQAGIPRTKKFILGYIILFLVAVFTLWYLKYVGAFYLVIAGVLGLYWLFIGIRGFKSLDDSAWARQMFRFSLITLTMTSVVIAIDAIIHV